MALDVNDVISALDPAQDGRKADGPGRALIAEEMALSRSAECRAAARSQDVPSGAGRPAALGCAGRSRPRKPLADRHVSRPAAGRALRHRPSQVPAIEAGDGVNPPVFREGFFDPESVRWYRRLFDERNAGKNRALSDVEFLNECGFVIEHDDLMVPTRAAVLVFGRARHVRRILPRPVVDCQFIDFTADSWTTDRRWNDRIVVEENLVQAWLMLSERYCAICRASVRGGCGEAPAER